MRAPPESNAHLARRDTWRTTWRDGSAPRLAYGCPACLTGAKHWRNDDKTAIQYAGGRLWQGPASFLDTERDSSRDATRSSPAQLVARRRAGRYAAHLERSAANTATQCVAVQCCHAAVVGGQGQGR